MRRFIFCLWCALLCALALGALALGNPKQAPAQAGAALPPDSATAPYTPCTYTPLSFQIIGSADIEDTRPFTTTAGDNYLQFVPAQPITATASSNGYALLNGGWSGTVQSGINGTFAAPNLNGLAVTGSTASPDGRGFQVNEIVIQGATGTIIALLAFNFTATAPAPPFYPRHIDGYLHSTVTSGSYAPYKFVGNITGNVGQPLANGLLPVIATVEGRLYSGGGSYNMTAAGSRRLPRHSDIALQPTDLLAQFLRPDFAANTSVGRIEPMAVFTGQTSPMISGAFALDHQSLLLNAGTTTDNGWLAGNLRITAPNGDKFEGPILGDLPDVAFHSYFFLNQGTGAYANSLVFAQFSGAIAYNGGTDIAGGGGGVYCDGMQAVGTPTPVGTATAIPSFTPTPTASPTLPAFTATFTYTPNPIPTVTALPTGVHCQTNVSNATTNCVPPSTYTDTFTFGTRCDPGYNSTLGWYTVYFEIASSSNGPWTTIDQQASGVVGFHEGYIDRSNVFTETNISPQYAWYRMRLDGYVQCTGDLCRLEGQTSPTLICAQRGTPTPTNTPAHTLTPIRTATFTRTPFPSVTETFHTLTPTHISTPTPTPCAITFTDIHPTDYFYQAVQYLYCARAISGYADNTFRPYNNTTRAQLCKIVVLAEGWTIYTPPGPTFSDVPPDNPFYTYVETAYHQNIISGYADGAFRPGNNVTRAQLCKIIVLAQAWTITTPPTPTFTDVPPSDPFYSHIETAHEHGVISGYSDGTFRPGNPATRGQICKIVYQAIAQP